MVDEKRLAATMKSLDMTREEVLAMWADDADIDKGKTKEFDLTPEQQKSVKQYIKTTSKKPANYSMENAAKKRAPRKPNDEKRSIITSVKNALDDFHQILEEDEPAASVENIEITNVEREITFTIGENAYSLTLTCHRKPKK